MLFACNLFVILSVDEIELIRKGTLYFLPMIDPLLRAIHRYVNDWKSDYLGCRIPPNLFHRPKKRTEWMKFYSTLVLYSSHSFLPLNVIKKKDNRTIIKKNSKISNLNNPLNYDSRKNYFHNFHIHSIFHNPRIFPTTSLQRNNHPLLLNPCPLRHRDESRKLGGKRTWILIGSSDRDETISQCLALFDLCPLIYSSEPAFLHRFSRRIEGRGRKKRSSFREEPVSLLPSFPWPSLLRVFAFRWRSI